MPAASARFPDRYLTASGARQGDPEPAAVCRSDGFDIPVDASGEAARERQTEPGSGGAVASAPTTPGLEDRLPFLRRDTRAVVVDGERDRAVVLRDGDG